MAHDIQSLLTSGYLSGSSKAEKFPASSAHPAFVHGFLNAQDDLARRPRKPIAQLRADLAYIRAVERDYGIL